VHHAVLLKLMSEAGVEPDNVYFHEHNPDDNYGTGSHENDFESLFVCPYNPRGKDILGKSITEVARKVLELGTHENYVGWFEATYQPLFCLNNDAKP
jgi:hypothetical protein